MIEFLIASIEPIIYYICISYFFEFIVYLAFLTAYDKMILWSSGNSTPCLWKYLSGTNFSGGYTIGLFAYYLFSWDRSVN